MATAPTGRPTDTDLVAHIDGELPVEKVEWMENWLARDAELRERLALLSRGARPFAEAFGLVLTAAPKERLERMLEALPGQRQADNAIGMRAPQARSARARIRSRLGLMAAGILLFVAGAFFQREFVTLREMAGLETAEQDEDEWRQAAAQYVSLYTSETISGIPDDMAPRERELAMVAARLGIPLPLKSIILPGLSLKRAQLLQYEGKPLGQIAYLDPHDGAVALCIYSAAHSDTPPTSERLVGLNVVHWSSRGRAFMLVGHLPAPRLQELASLLSQQLTL
jgi:anti-sigma factor RsiW